MKRLDFKAINAAALPHLLDLAREVDRDAKREAGEIIFRNPRRADASPGSFSINATTGKWSDFATDNKGGDVVSWWAYSNGLGQVEAARDLARRFAPDLIKPDFLAPAILTAPADAPEPDFARYAKPGETFSAAWCYRDAHGARLGFAMRFDGPEGKQIRPLRWGGSAWECRAFHEPRPLYNLDKLAEHPGAKVIVCEGEKAASAAMVHFPHCIAVTSPGGANAASKASWAPLQGRAVTIWPDNDDPGRKYADAVAKLAHAAGAASVRVVSVPSTFPKSWDLADSIPEGADLRAMLDAAVEAACPRVPPPDEAKPAESGALGALVARLANLSPLEYETKRAAEAEAIGVRVTALDDAVKAARMAGQKESGKREMFPPVEPWSEPVEVGPLLDELVSTIGRFIVCNAEVKIAAALWIAASWCIDGVQVAPIAFITAPEKRCGKSQLLDLIGRTCRRPLVASNISPAAVFRVIEAHEPTLLLDEADSFMRENEELRGVLNSGHTRQSAYVIRTVGDDHEPRQFSTWGFKAIAGIGTQASTIMDRSIVLTLRRKLPTEQAQRLRYAPADLFPRLASMLARFAEDSLQSVKAARPALPEALGDRAQDNWEPLLAVADLAGSEWSQKARRAALILSGAEHDAPSTSAELLADIKEAFEQTGQAHAGGLLWTADLLRALVSNELAPWAAYSRGQAMTARQLAKRLDDYGIKSANCKHSGSGVVKKGYRWEQFGETFARYLDTPPDTSLSMRYSATTEDLCAPDGGGTVAVADGCATDGVAVAIGNGMPIPNATPEPAPLLGGSGVADTRGMAGKDTSSGSDDEGAA